MRGDTAQYARARADWGFGTAFRDEPQIAGFELLQRRRSPQNNRPIAGRSPYGETQTRTGDTTIFRHAARRVEWGRRSVGLGDMTLARRIWWCGSG
jgi:hypothetical protein